MLLSGLNLCGVRESGIAEDIFVYAKVLIILLTTGAGLLRGKRAQALPVFEQARPRRDRHRPLIFVAYEGFELLAYDYEAIATASASSRSPLIAIPAVAVPLHPGGLRDHGRPADASSPHNETVLAYVAQPMLGRWA